jgi:TRAP-type uncharacterized transport system substrate-binding protein
MVQRHTQRRINANTLSILSKYKEKYRLNSWKDLDGKKVFLHSVKYETNKWHAKALKTLGVNFTHVEMDLEMVATLYRKVT